jgi:hypothetical protein
VTEVFLRSLRDYLPDKLARKRWRASLNRLVHSEGTFRSLQSDDRPLVTSHLPALLRKIHGELGGVQRTEDALRLAPYIRILDYLTAEFEAAESTNEEFILTFQQIAGELKRICELMGGTEETDAAACAHGPVSLDELLSRISQLRRSPDPTDNRQPSSPLTSPPHSPFTSSPHSPFTPSPLSPFASSSLSRLTSPPHSPLTSSPLSPLTSRVPIADGSALST